MEITGLDNLLNFLSISVSYEKVRYIIILLIQKEEYNTWIKYIAKNMYNLYFC